MIIYKDVLTGDEVISDVYDLKPTPGAEGLWEADLKMTTVGGDNFQLEGANASAEEAEDTLEDAAEQKLDIVVSFRLTSIPRPEKKTAQADYKKYAKAVLEHLKTSGKAEQAAEFQKTAPAAIKKILGNWDNFDVYVGESMAEPAMWILVDYREDGVTPYATFWRHALDEMKV